MNHLFPDMWVLGFRCWVLGARCRNNLFVLSIALALIGLPGPVGFAQPGVALHPRVILVVVPSLRADDLTQPELASLTDWLRNGASGWMVCRAAQAASREQLQPDGRDRMASLLLTLNAGA